MPNEPIKDEKAVAVAPEKPKDLPPAKKYGNPGVIGLAGFGITTLLLQFHNIGWCGVGPVMACAFIFGGLGQFIGGFHEWKVGNNFGYSAFVTYGSFWMCWGTIQMLNYWNIYKLTKHDVGWWLVGFMVYTSFMVPAACHLHFAMSLTFLTLEVGFWLLIAAHFVTNEHVDQQLTKAAGYDLIPCALSAFWMMGSSVWLQIFGRNIIPLGPALI